DVSAEITGGGARRALASRAPAAALCGSVQCGVGRSYARADAPGLSEQRPLIPPLRPSFETLASQAPQDDVRIFQRLECFETLVEFSIPCRCLEPRRRAACLFP